MFSRTIWAAAFPLRMKTEREFSTPHEGHGGQELFLNRYFNHYKEVYIVYNHRHCNKAILSNKWYSIIYCIFLFLCCAFLDIFCKKAVIHISYYRLWNSIPIVFIIQNVVIIIKRNISNLSQNNS